MDLNDLFRSENEGNIVLQKLSAPVTITNELMVEMVDKSNQNAPLQ